MINGILFVQIIILTIAITACIVSIIDAFKK